MIAVLKIVQLSTLIRFVTAGYGFILKFLMLSLLIIISANLRTNLNIISYINKLLCNDGRKWYFTIKVPVYKEINLARIRTMNAAKKS